MKGKKGTVTPLSSVFSAEDTHKAAQRVHDTIAQKHLDLQRLLGFVANNTDLINRVSRLPDYGPIWSVSILPRAISATNEFMVLLGEGYYAESTSKQTVDILKRRGKVLEIQVDFLKAIVKDLDAEASVFISTASEAAEGLVEIMEDYEEESSSGKESALKQDPPKNYGAIISEHADEDEEFSRMMARMDALEKEESEAESQMSQHDEDEQVHHCLQQLSIHKFLRGNLETSEVELQSQSTKPREKTKDVPASNKDCFTNEPSHSGLEMISEDKLSHGRILAHDVKHISERALVSPAVENFQNVPSSRSQTTLYIMDFRRHPPSPPQPDPYAPPPPHHHHRGPPPPPFPEFYHPPPPPHPPHNHHHPPGPPPPRPFATGPPPPGPPGPPPPYFDPYRPPPSHHYHHPPPPY